MANPNALRPSIGRVLRLQETRQWLPTSSTSASIAQPRIATSSFSSSAARSVRKTRDNNRLRGVTTMRRSGPREPLSVSWEELPKPANYKRTVGVDPNHGLWDFFYDKKLVNTPSEDQAHGRAWMVEELRKKSWDDLHALWYVCLKERNRISTTSRERTRRQLGFGSYEANERDETVLKTMKAIKHVLTERFYVWEDARVIAENDPEIDLTNESGAYTPLNGHQYAEPVVEEQVAEEQVAEEHVAEESLPAEKEAAAEEVPAEQKKEPAAEAETKTEDKPVQVEEKIVKKPEQAKKAEDKADTKPVDIPVPRI
ncbi:mitochondrial 54S ribosomal protein uL29m [Colletotrichum truncatum]|uniref:54S ribosomal protein L4, mitochondrial n=1 Tax=Colletotrichum truncatum TaxID=5467 RepID=A0ACC3ZJJ0_COLTU|nr:54S ribosomal protein L4, mitochondrial [Colletotrichum truncatum]KAF6799629.1 54S ribosomal protein L4, mitochondrial [Colletotrichum truncatum]